MFTGIAIFASVVLWLMVKEKGFRKVVFIGFGIVAVLGMVIVVWYYSIHVPGKVRHAKEEAAAFTTVNLKDGTVLKLKGSNLTPDQVALGVENFREQQAESGRQIVPPPLSDSTVNAFIALDDNKKREALKKMSEPAKQALLAALKSRKAAGELFPCSGNDPLGIRSTKPCVPPAPKLGVPPCPVNDPIGMNTAQPCAPLPATR